MHKYTIRKIKTKTGNLYIGNAYSIHSLNGEKFDIIWNLASELKDLISLEQEHSKSVIFANIEDYSYPKDILEFKHQLNCIVSSLKNNEKILIHCFGGIGRTGMALACVKIMLDQFSINDAIKFSLETCGGPEDDSQIEFIYNLFSKKN